MRRVEHLIIIIPICFTVLIVWFSWSVFRIAPQMAAESLRSAGLSIATAIEEITTVDPDPNSLTYYSTPDIAYYSVIGNNGLIRFHTNEHLIGTVWAEPKPKIDSKSGIHEERKKLGTGEEVYILHTRIHPTGANCLLTLALHTYRADQVIRRAQTVVVMSTLLTITLWLVTLGLIHLLRRDRKRQIEMQRREELAHLGELGAVMAHEIRNPLAGIKGFAQLIETVTNIELARAYAGKIVKQSLRMESLVNDLLTFAREDRGERHPVNLTALLSDCVTMIQMETAATGVVVVYTPQPVLKIMAKSDQIVQLLLNLLKNGFQAMPDGGELRIELGHKNSRAIITVSDSGIGIPAENIPHIFEPFWTSKARGTGLGLALCRKVAQEHGGDLTVESTPGVGTTFTVTLPMEI